MVGLFGRTSHLQTCFVPGGLLVAGNLLFPGVVNFNGAVRLTKATLGRENATSVWELTGQLLQGQQAGQF